MKANNSGAFDSGFGGTISSAAPKDLTMLIRKKPAAPKPVWNGRLVLGDFFLTCLELQAPSDDEADAKKQRLE